LLFHGSGRPIGSATISRSRDPPQGCERVSSNDVTIDSRGLIYLIDRQRGIDIIQTSVM
jgi:hypothetical protein